MGGGAVSSVFVGAGVVGGGVLVGVVAATPIEETWLGVLYWGLEPLVPGTVLAGAGAERACGVEARR